MARHGGMVRWFAGAVAMLAALVWARPASAQFEALAMGSDLFSIGSPLNTKSLDVYAQTLRLDKDQHDAAKELLKGYRGGLADMLRDLKKRGEEFQEKPNKTPEEQTEMMASIMKEAAERNRKLEGGFFEDLKSLLMPEQVERWGAVERARRREVWQKFGLMYGEGVDLSGTLVRAKVDASKTAGLPELLDAYETEVDRIMQNRERLVKDYGSRMKGKKLGPEAFFGDADMMKSTQEAFKGWIQDGKKVRDLNKSYQRRVLDVLPEDSKPAFEAEVRRRAFPPVYRENDLQRLLTKAMKIPRLDANVKAELEAIRESYEREAAPINDKWSKALEAQQDGAGEDMMGFMMQMGGNSDARKAINEQKKAREELDKKFEEKIEKLLTEDQRKAMEEDDNGKRRRRFGPEDGPFHFDPEDLEILEMLDD